MNLGCFFVERSKLFLSMYKIHWKRSKSHNRITQRTTCFGRNPSRVKIQKFPHQLSSNDCPEPKKDLWDKSATHAHTLKTKAPRRKTSPYIFWETFVLEINISEVGTAPFKSSCISYFRWIHYLQISVLSYALGKRLCKNYNPYTHVSFIYYFLYRKKSSYDLWWFIYRINIFY